MAKRWAIDIGAADDKAVFDAVEKLISEGKSKIEKGTVVEIIYENAKKEKITEKFTLKNSFIGIPVMGADGKEVKGPDGKTKYKAYAIANKKYNRDDSKLGEGAYGKVKLAQDVDGHNFAVKIEARGKRGEDDAELRIMKAIGYTKGETVRQLEQEKEFKGKKTKQKLYTMMELREGKELFNELYTNALTPGQLYVPGSPERKDELSSAQKLIIAIRCCQAIQDLHYRGVVHGDVKPANFMANIQGDHIVLGAIDFGFSFQLKEGEKSIKHKGIPQGTHKDYMPPEVIENNARGEEAIFSPASDVYSLGKMLQEDFGLPKEFCEAMLKSNPDERLPLPEVIRRLGTELEKELERTPEAERSPDAVQCAFEASSGIKQMKEGAGPKSKDDFISQVMSGFHDPIDSFGTNKFISYTMQDYKTLAQSIYARIPPNDYKATVWGDAGPEKNPDGSVKTEIKDGFFTQLGKAYNKLTDEEDKLIFLHNTELFIKEIIRANPEVKFVDSTEKGIAAFVGSIIEKEKDNKKINDALGKMQQNLDVEIKNRRAINESRKEKNLASSKENAALMVVTVGPKKIEEALAKPKKNRLSRAKTAIGKATIGQVSKKAQSHADEAEIAKALAHDFKQIQLDIIRQIDISDFHKVAWTKNSNLSSKKFTDMVNNTANSTRDRILGASSLSEQRRIYRIYLQTALECIKNNDYMSAVAIYSGVAASPIERLSYLNDDPIAKEMRKELDEICNPQGNYKNIGKQIEIANAEGKTAIPFIGQMQTFLVGIDENPNEIRGKMNEGKLLMEGRLLRNFADLQEHAFNQKTEAHQTNLLQDLARPMLTEDDAYNMSVSILSRADRAAYDKGDKKPLLRFLQPINLQEITSLDALKTKFPNGAISKQLSVEKDGKIYYGKKAYKKLLEKATPYLDQSKEGILNKQFAVNFLTTFSERASANRILKGKVEENINELSKGVELSSNDLLKINILNYLNTSADTYTKLDVVQQAEVKNMIDNIEKDIYTDPQGLTIIKGEKDETLLAEARKVKRIVADLDKIVEIEQEYQKLKSDFEKLKQFSTEIVGTPALFSYLNDAVVLKAKLESLKNDSNPLVKEYAHATSLVDEKSGINSLIEEVKKNSVDRIETAVDMYMNLIEEKNQLSGNKDQNEERLKEIEQDLVNLEKGLQVFMKEGASPDIKEKAKQAKEVIDKVKKISTLTESFKNANPEAKENIARELSGYPNEKTPAVMSAVKSLYNDEIKTKINETNKSDLDFLKGNAALKQPSINEILKSEIELYVASIRKADSEETRKAHERKIEIMIARFEKIEKNSPSEIKAEASKVQLAIKEQVDAYKKVKEKANKPVQNAAEPAAEASLQSRLGKVFARLKGGSASPAEPANLEPTAADLLIDLEVAAKLKDPITVVTDLANAKPETVFRGLVDAYNNKNIHDKIAQKVFPSATREDILQYIVRQIETDPLIPLYQSLYALDNLQGVYGVKDAAKERAGIYAAYQAKITALMQQKELTAQQKTDLVQLFNEIQLMTANPPASKIEQKALANLSAIVSEHYNDQEMTLHVGDNSIDLGVALKKEKQDRKVFDEFRVKLDALEGLPADEKKDKLIALIKELREKQNVTLQRIPMVDYKEAISSFLIKDKTLLMDMLSSENPLSAVDKRDLAANCIDYLKPEGVRKLLFEDADLHASLVLTSERNSASFAAVYEGITDEQRIILHERLYEAIKNQDFDEILILKGFKADIEFKKDEVTIARLLERMSANPKAWQQFVKKGENGEKYGNSVIGIMFSDSINKKSTQSADEFSKIAFILSSISSPHASSVFRTGPRGLLSAGLIQSPEEEAFFTNFIKASRAATEHARKGGAKVEYELTKDELSKLQRLHAQITGLLYPDTVPNLVKYNELESQCMKMDEQIKKLQAEMGEAYAKQGIKNMGFGVIDISSAVNPADFDKLKEEIKSSLEIDEATPTLTSEQREKFQRLYHALEFTETKDLKEILAGLKEFIDENKEHKDVIYPVEDFFDMLNKRVEPINKLATQIKEIEQKLAPIEAAYKQQKEANKKYSDFTAMLRGPQNSLMQGTNAKFLETLAANPPLYALIMNNFELIKTINQKYQVYQKAMAPSLDDPYFKRSEELKAQKRAELEAQRKAHEEKTGEKLPTPEELAERGEAKIKHDRPLYAVHDPINKAKTPSAMIEAFAKIDELKVSKGEIEKAIIFDLKEKIAEYQKKPSAELAKEILFKCNEAEKRGLKANDALKITAEFMFDELEKLSDSYYKHFNALVNDPAKHGDLIKFLESVPQECKAFIEKLSAVDTEKNRDLKAIKERAQALGTRVDEDIKQFGDLAKAREAITEKGERKLKSVAQKLQSTKDAESGLRVIQLEAPGAINIIRRRANNALRGIRERARNLFGKTSEISSVPSGESLQGTNNVVTPIVSKPSKAESKEETLTDVVTPPVEPRISPPIQIVDVTTSHVVSDAHPVSSVVTAPKKTSPLKSYLKEPSIPEIIRNLAAEGGPNARQLTKEGAKAGGRGHGWVGQTFGRNEDTLLASLKNIDGPQTYTMGEIKKTSEKAAEAVVEGEATPLITVVQGVSASDLHRYALGDNSVFQVASQFDFQESRGAFDTPVSDYPFDPTQGPYASIEAAAGALHRKAAKKSGKLPHALTDMFPEGLLAKYPNLYKDGYLELSTITEEADKQRLLDHIEANIDKLKILPQWVTCEATQVQQLQVFTAAPSFQTQSIPDVHSVDHQICEALVVAQYRASAQLAVIRSRETGLTVPLHLTMVGQGAFNNNPIVMQKAMEAVAQVVKGEKVAVYVHAYSAADKDKLMPQMTGSFNIAEMNVEEFKRTPHPNTEIKFSQVCQGLGFISTIREESIRKEISNYDFNSGTGWKEDYVPKYPELSTDEKAANNRQGVKVYMELVDTEAAYVDDLARISDPENKKAILALYDELKPEELKGFTSKEEISQFLDKIAKLKAGHEEVLKALKEPNPEKWAENIAKLKALYVDFGLTFEKIKIPSSVDQKFRGPTGGGLSLSDYIIKPVQRMTKYPLLVRELEKTVSEESSFYAGFMKAKEGFLAIPDAVNYAKTINEESSKFNAAVLPYQQQPTKKSFVKFIETLPVLQGLKPAEMQALFEKVDFSHAGMKGKQKFEEYVFQLMPQKDLDKATPEEIVLNRMLMNKVSNDKVIDRFEKLKGKSSVSEEDKKIIDNILQEMRKQVKNGEAINYSAAINSLIKNNENDAEKYINFSKKHEDAIIKIKVMQEEYKPHKVDMKAANKDLAYLRGAVYSEIVNNLTNYNSNINLDESLRGLIQARDKVKQLSVSDSPHVRIEAKKTLHDIDALLMENLKVEKPLSQSQVNQIERVFENAEGFAREYYKTFNNWLTAVKNGNTPEANEQELRLRKLEGLSSQVRDYIAFIDTLTELKLPQIADLKLKADDMRLAMQENENQARSMVKVRERIASMDEERKKGKAESILEKIKDVPDPVKGFMIANKETSSLLRTAKKKINKVKKAFTGVSKKKKSSEEIVAPTTTAAITTSPPEPVADMHRVNAEKTVDLKLPANDPHAKVLAQAIKEAKTIPDLIQLLEKWEHDIISSNGKTIDKKIMLDSLRKFSSSAENIELFAKITTTSPIYGGSHITSNYGLREKFASLAKEQHKSAVNLQAKPLTTIPEQSTAAPEKKPELAERRNADKRKAMMVMGPQKIDPPPHAVIFQGKGSISQLNNYLTNAENASKHNIKPNSIREVDIKTNGFTESKAKALEMTFEASEARKEFKAYAHDDDKKQGVVFSLEHGMEKDPEKFRAAVEEVCYLAVVNAGKGAEFDLSVVKDEKVRAVVEEAFDKAIQKAVDEKHLSANEAEHPKVKSARL
ncbi:MAG: hypothetical protein BGO43_14215 [Gammaproteobacteria bacterium 39-13]|nr:protein kinase [Gammaproteobacteria bacterium]OJV89840.1 MAG: hypothetical protein BGO43_14215 [Gammaproteobacteria bacterium 39-13]